MKEENGMTATPVADKRNAVGVSPTQENEKRNGREVRSATNQTAAEWRVEGIRWRKNEAR